MVGLIAGIITKSNEPVVLGYSHTVLSMEFYHSADSGGYLLSEHAMVLVIFAIERKAFYDRSLVHRGSFLAI